MKDILPPFPRTFHLPYRPNLSHGDEIANDADFLLTDPNVFIEEKIDGSNCAMMLYEGEAIIRNRDHILKKGYLKDTPAKLQFRPAWNWFYDNKEKFIKLNEICGVPMGVYIEWCWALHGIVYDKLPSYAIAFDLYDSEKKYFLDVITKNNLLNKVGFTTPKLLHSGPIESWGRLDDLCQLPSEFSSQDLIEGLYIKHCNGDKIINRFKMIRPDYKQGSKWSVDKITKQKLQGKTHI